MDNSTTQREEIECLAAIYGEDWQVDNAEEGLYHITIGDHIPVTLLLEFPENYPSDSPPYCKVMAPSLNTHDVEEINNILQELYLKNVGESIVYLWIEQIKEWVQDKISSLPEEEEITENLKFTTNPGPSPEDFSTEEEVAKICAQLQENVDISRDPKPFVAQPAKTSYLRIIHGDPITFKKSTFQGHATIISDPKDADAFVRELMEDKKIARATHNIQAYRIFKEKNSTYDEHFEDDGEKQAGHRLLRLMQVMNVQNIMVVVSRWYGGVLLGPDRFRLINNTAQAVLEKGNFIPSQDVKKKK